MLARHISRSHWALPTEIVNFIVLLVWEPPLISISEMCALITYNNHVCIIWGNQRIRLPSPPGRVFAQALYNNYAYVATSGKTHGAHPKNPGYIQNHYEASTTFMYPTIHKDAIYKCFLPNIPRKWELMRSFPKILSLSHFADVVAVVVQHDDQQELWMSGSFSHNTFGRIQTGFNIQLMGCVAICDGIANKYGSLMAPMQLFCEFASSVGGRVPGPASLHYINCKTVIKDRDGVYWDYERYRYISDIDAHTRADAFPPNALAYSQNGLEVGYANARGVYRVNTRAKPTKIYPDGSSLIITWAEFGRL